MFLFYIENLKQYFHKESIYVYKTFWTNLKEFKENKWEEF